MLSKEDFALFKANMKQRYNSLPSPVKCHPLNRMIVLNARGFHHLSYDGSGKARTTREAYDRLRLVPLIVPVLRNAIDCTYEVKFGRKNRKKDSPSVKIEKWGMEATVGKKRDCRVKVIVKRENGGQIFFWSVMKVR